MKAVPVAHHVTVAGCAGCACGRIMLRLHREDGTIFAVAPFEAEGVEPLAELIRRRGKPAERRVLN